MDGMIDGMRVAFCERWPSADVLEGGTSLIRIQQGCAGAASPIVRVPHATKMFVCLGTFPISA